MSREYFPHDYHARSELRDISMRYGIAGIGFYWCLVEILHENGGSIKEKELRAIAYELRVEEELCEWVVRESGFFSVKKGVVSADRVARNLKKRAEISEARRASANARWNSQEGAQSPSGEDLPDIPPMERNDSYRFSEDAEAVFREYHEKFYTKSIDEHKPYFRERLDKLESELLDVNDDVFTIEPLLMNLLDELKIATLTTKYLTINKKKVHINDFLHTLGYFFMDTQGVEDFLQVMHEVDKKVRKGRVKNKQNYLVSTLYITAKMNGG